VKGGNQPTNISVIDRRASPAPSRCLSGLRTTYNRARRARPESYRLLDKKSHISVELRGWADRLRRCRSDIPVRSLRSAARRFPSAISRYLRNGRLSTALNGDGELRKRNFRQARPLIDPKPTVGLWPDSGGNALVICRLAFRGLVRPLRRTQTNDQRRRPENPYFRLYRSSRFKKASSPPSRIRRTALFVTSASKLPEVYFSTPLMLSATTTCSASALTTRLAL